MKLRLAVVSVLLALTIFGASVSAQIDTSKVGVSTGDTFTLNLVESTGVLDSASIEDATGINFSIGDSVTFTIDDATVDENNSIAVTAVSSTGSSYSENIRLDAFALSPVIFTDWDYWSTNVTELEIPDVDMQDATFGFANGADLFTVSMLSNAEGNTFSISLSYKKDTGVLNEFSLSFSITNQGFSLAGSLLIQNADFVSATAEEEAPGFLIIPAFMTATLIAVFTLRRRK